MFKNVREKSKFSISTKMIKHFIQVISIDRIFYEFFCNIRHKYSAFVTQTQREVNCQYPAKPALTTVVYP